MTTSEAPAPVNGRDIVLFLGAGFSYDAGLPTMAEFGDLSIRAQTNLPKHAIAPPDSKHFRHAAPRLMKAYRTFQGFRNVCQESGALPKSDWNNIEDVFCVAEGLLQAGQKEVIIGQQPYSLSTVVRDIQLWIWKTYQQLPLLQRNQVVKRPVKKQPYESLFSHIVQSRLARSLTVLTTNYDLVFEYLAFRNGIPCYYPFDWSQSFAAGHGDADYVFGPSRGGESPLICKLHGSVNYFANHEHDPSAVWVAADIGGGRDIGNSGGGPFSNAPAVLAVDALWNIQTRYGEGFVPAIIPPTYAKLHDMPWLKTIWNAALNALVNARLVMFIGYSLPRSDGFMSALMTGALALRGGRNPPTIAVVDPSAATHARFRELFGPLKVESELLSFSDAADGLIPSMLER